MTAEELKREIGQFLDAHHVVSLATVRGRDLPHAANVFYAFEGLSLVWTSAPDTRHSLHIDANPRIAATIAPDYTDFRLVRGLQIFGRARRLTDAAEAAHVRQLLCLRYPFLQELASGPPVLREALEKAGFYRLDPESIALIDNTKGFGHKETLLIAVSGDMSLAASSGA